MGPVGLLGGSMIGTAVYIVVSSGVEEFDQGDTDSDSDDGGNSDDNPTKLGDLSTVTLKEPVEV